MLWKKKNSRVRTRPLITQEYLKNVGIDITDEQYYELTRLNVMSNCAFSAYEVLQALKILGLI